MAAAYGYAGKMLFVDLNTGKIHEEELTDDLARAYVGGYGLGVRTMIERIPQGVDPLGPENMFGIGTGPFTHSGVLSSCRFTTMGKSPLTGYWGDANSGGTLGNGLKASGYDAIFFQGRSEQPVYLLIVDGKPELKDARHLWGVDTNQTEDTIRSENNNNLLKIASIGPGGEMLSRMAAVINDKGRAAARSGLGAVMGSKNLKAVACYGTLRPPVYDKAALKQLMKQVVTTMKTNPTFMFQELSKTGTPGAMTHHMAEHDVPIKNWSGNFIDDFPEDKWEKVAWPGMEAYVDKKYACTGCPIGCGSIVSLPDGTKYKVKGRA